MIEHSSSTIDSTLRLWKK